jgi:hypothetical protein
LPGQAKRLTSLRSGFLTSAAANGASIFKMMDVSRHRSVETWRGNVRDAEIFKDHTGQGCFRSVPDAAFTKGMPISENV